MTYTSAYIHLMFIILWILWIASPNFTKEVCWQQGT